MTLEMEEEGTAALCLAIGSSDRKAIMGRLHVQGSLDSCLQVSRALRIHHTPEKTCILLLMLSKHLSSRLLTKIIKIRKCTYTSH